MRILVTGGAGFIGGHIAEQLARSDHHVTVLDNLVPYYDLGIKERNVEVARQAADNGDGEYTFVEGSITDCDLAEDTVADIDVIYVDPWRTALTDDRTTDRVETTAATTVSARLPTNTSASNPTEGQGSSVMPKAVRRPTASKTATTPSATTSASAADAPPIRTASPTTTRRIRPGDAPVAR